MTDGQTAILVGGVLLAAGLGYLVFMRGQEPATPAGSTLAPDQGSTERVAWLGAFTGLVNTGGSIANTVLQRDAQNAKGVGGYPGAGAHYQGAK